MAYRLGIAVQSALVQPTDPTHEQRLPVHLGIGVRGASGQDCRPDLGRGPRRDPRRRPACKGCVRNHGQDRRRDRRRRDHHDDLHRFRGPGSQDRTRHRLQRFVSGLRRCVLRRPERRGQAVAEHRAGRRPGDGRGTGRGRPGHDVRLRDERNRRPDAGPDHLSHTGWSSGRPRCARMARCRGSGPTRRAR